jgi:hypothetical protein
VEVVVEMAVAVVVLAAVAVGAFKNHELIKNRKARI